MSNLERSIIPACDVRTLEQLEKIVKVAKDFPQVRAYKVGFSLGLRYSLPKVVESVKKHHPGAVVIYDHQKAGSDIPDPSGKEFADTMFYSGVDAAIIFPHAGPETQIAFINELMKIDIGVIAGGEMTHKAFVQSEGGYISDEALQRMYALSADLGVTDFVVPGNKPLRIAVYRQLIECMGVAPTFYSPGLVTQGGDITEAAKVAGPRWHAICGRDVYNPNKSKNLDDVSEQDIHDGIARLVKNI